MIHQLLTLPRQPGYGLRLYALGLLCLATLGSAWAQPTLRVGAGTRLTSSGSVRLVYGGGTLANNGALNLPAGQLTAAGPATYTGTGMGTVATAFFNHTTGSSLLNSQLSVTGQATLASGTRLNANGQLYLRTDGSPDASLVNNGLLTGNVLGLLTRATQITGTTPFNTTLSTNVSGSSMRYQWQTSANGAVFTNVAGATSPTYSVYVDGRAFYRCLLTTTNTDYSQTTPALEARATQPLGTNGLTVLHRDVDNYADNNAIQPLLQVVNQSSRSLPYSGLSLRYYVTVEGASTLTNLFLDYAQVGNQNVKLRYVALSPAQTGADGYVEVNFTDGAGTLAAGGNSGSIKAYFAKADYGPLNELNDYSYATVRDQLVANPRITAYYNGVLVYGTEPGGTTTMPTPGTTAPSLRALTESKNGPSATQINTFLEIRNEGASAVAYSDLKARYYFTSNGTERLQVEIDEGNVRGQLVKLNPAVSGADTYLELTFTQGGQLAAGASTGRIRYRISKPDGGRFNQADDYSYQEQPAERSQNPRVTVYVGQERAWGSEPAAPANSGKRMAASTEPGSNLRVQVLGNPIEGDHIRLEVSGVQGQPLHLSVSDLTGRVVAQQHIEAAALTDQQSLDVSGSVAGLLLLQVSSPGQTQTLKVLKRR